MNHSISQRRHEILIFHCIFNRFFVHLNIYNKIELLTGNDKESKSIFVYQTLFCKQI